MKKDFLKLTDLTKVEVLELLKKAAELKKFKAEGTTHQTLEGRTLGMVFKKILPEPEFLSKWECLN